MGLNTDLVRVMRKRDWRPIEVEAGSERLEVFPLTSSLGAGFTLWERHADGNWSVETTGHTRDDVLFAPHGDPLVLESETSARIESLLRHAGG